MKLNKHPIIPIEEQMLQIISEVEKMMESVSESIELFNKFEASTDFDYLKEIESKLNYIKALQDKIEKILSWTVTNANVNVIIPIILAINVSVQYVNGLKRIKRNIKNCAKDFLDCLEIKQYELQ